MLLDIMSPYNQLQVNVKLINLTGLNTATYWSVLLDIYARVINKKFDETVQNSGFFSIDRQYIERRTSLTPADQTVCDKVLSALDVLEKQEDSDNMIRIDLERMKQILVEDDSKVLAKIQAKAKVKRRDVATQKRESIKENLKAHIEEPDVDLLKAYEQWVDSIIDSKNFLSIPAVTAFRNTINKFTADKVVKLEVIEIAMIHAYKDAAWAIQQYASRHKFSATRLSNDINDVATVNTDIRF
jgi:hypothetical protein